MSRATTTPLEECDKNVAPTGEGIRITSSGSSSGPPTVGATFLSHSSNIARKQNRIFFLCCTLFVVVTSFLYGIITGLSRQSTLPPAMALMPGTGEPITAAEANLPFALAGGMELSPLARDLLINGKAMQVFQVSTDRDPRTVLVEQAAAWKNAGMKVIGGAPGRKGLALAVNEQTGERALLILSRIPPTLRHVRPEAVIGFLSYDPGLTGPVKEASERTGEVPGVPTMPGGRGGAVLSAKDTGGRTLSGVYTNPGSVEDGMDFYGEFLAADGWKVTHRDSGERAQVAFGSMMLRRENEQLTLLFSNRGKASETGVFVSKAAVPR